MAMGDNVIDSWVHAHYFISNAVTFMVRFIRDRLTNSFLLCQNLPKSTDAFLHLPAVAGLLISHILTVPKQSSTPVPLDTMRRVNRHPTRVSARGCVADLLASSPTMNALGVTWEPVQAAHAFINSRKCLRSRTRVDHPPLVTSFCGKQQQSSWRLIRLILVSATTIGFSTFLFATVVRILVPLYLFTFEVSMVISS